MKGFPLRGACVFSGGMTTYEFPKRAVVTAVLVNGQRHPVPPMEVQEGDQLYASPAGGVMVSRTDGTVERHGNIDLPQQPAAPRGWRGWLRSLLGR